FSPAVRMRKQLALEPFQVVQKPSLVSFQVPSPLAPVPASGSRVILPSALNTILNLTFAGVAGGKGWPGKEVDWVSLGVSTRAAAGAIAATIAMPATIIARMGGSPPGFVWAQRYSKLRQAAASGRASCNGRPPAAHSIDGNTRSGGRWPSRKVRMLTITFSP